MLSCGTIVMGLVRNRRWQDFLISLSNCKSENFSGNASLPPSTTIRFRLQNDLRPRPMDVDFCPWFSHDAQIPEDRWSHELEKVDATHGQLLIRHDLAIPQSLELGCKLHRDARDEVTTTVATNVTHAAAHSLTWPVNRDTQGHAPWADQHQP